MGPSRMIAVSVAVVAALVVGGCASAEDLASATSSPDNSGGPDAKLTDGGGVVVSGADISDDAELAEDPVEVVVYEDFQCPYCAMFEESTGDYLEEQMLAGEITVEYRVVSFLDSASPNAYSSRAANAALCVFEEAGPGALYEFHATLFENQPSEGSAGPEDEQLTAYASDAGADVGSCIGDASNADRVEALTEQMNEEGVSATPTVFVDGEEVELDSVKDTIDSAVG